MKTVIITGATGFLGYALLRKLVQNDIYVCVLCRPDSKRRSRLEGLPNVEIIETDLCNTDKLSSSGQYDVFYHLAWEGRRNEFEEQYQNVDISLNCVKLAAKFGCKRFICTGSQAEYGETNEFITEETPLFPTTAYGSCKVAAYYLTRDLAKRLGMQHTWARVFSVYGENDNPNTLYSMVQRELSVGHDIMLETDGKHIWNYLHENDAARMLFLLGECGVTDTVFNVAHSESKLLGEYVEQWQKEINPNVMIHYGTQHSTINLKADVNKIQKIIVQGNQTKTEIK